MATRAYGTILSFTPAGGEKVAVGKLTSIGEITPDSELRADCGLSSFDSVCLLDSLCEKFGKEVDETVIRECCTVQDLANLFID